MEDIRINTESKILNDMIARRNNLISLRGPSGLDRLLDQRISALTTMIYVYNQANVAATQLMKEELALD